MQWRSWLGLVSIFISTNRCWDTVCFEPVPVLCILPENLWVHLNFSPLQSGGHSFLAVIHHLGIIIFLHLLPNKTASPERRGLLQKYWLGLIIPKSVFLMYVSYSFVSLCYFPSILKKKLLCLCLSKELIYWNGRVLLRVILLLCSFHRTIVLGFLIEI